MARRPRALALLVTHLLAAGAGAVAAAWLTGGGQVGRTYASPNGAYMLVLQHPNRLQRLRLLGATESPYVVELHRLHDQTVLCRTGVVDLFGDGEIAWTPAALQIGTQVNLEPFARNPDDTCRRAADAEPLLGANAPPRSMTAPYAPFAAARQRGGGG